jgi:hypothetical protein
MTRIQRLTGLALALCVAACADDPEPSLGETDQAVVLACTDLIPLYQRNNYDWWWGALGHCKTGRGGITDPAAIFECAWKQVPTDDQQACLRTNFEQASQTANGIDVVAAYNGRPTCRWLHQKYLANNYQWWYRALGNCKQGPGGRTDPEEIFNCAWNQVPVQDQQPCLRSDLWTAPVTPAGIVAVADANTNSACPQLQSRYQANNYATWWGALGNCKTGRGGPSNRATIFACAWNQLPASDQLPCLHKLLDEAAVTTRGVLEVRAANGIVGAVADDRTEQTFAGPEQCEAPTNGDLPDQYFAPAMPQSLVDGTPAGTTRYSGFNTPPGQNIGDNEGRLRADLREVAKLAEPITCTLPLAAYAFAHAKAATGADHDELQATATAYADLAVTGRRAFAKFAEQPPGSAYCTALATQPIDRDCPSLGAPPTPTELAEGCGHALDRAYDVANFLRTGQAVTAAGPWFDGDGMLIGAAATDHERKVVARDDLGWIAVSGEDDQPHRPVNVPSTDAPQFDIDVDVPVPLQHLGTDYPYAPLPERVHARFVIAQSRGAGLVAPRLANRWTLAPDYVPAIAPGAEVIFFIHGMDSRAEEAGDITRELFALMQKQESQKNLVIITVDLPSSGYTQNLDYTVISPLDAIGNPDGNVNFSASGRTPMLDFLETFVVRFAETLDKKVPFLGDVKAVMGGSLGGNLSFRLGRRPGTPWLPNVVVWSPASIWDSMGEGSDPGVHAGPRRTWFLARDYHIVDPNDPTTADRRRTFFVDGWDGHVAGVFIPISQPETWTSTQYPCRDAAIAGARLDRQETYDALFLSWRWRLASEQLLYSHHTTDPLTNLPRFMTNDKRMLLACGHHDNVPYNDICEATRKTARDLTLTPGKAEFLLDTGHSLDNERPRFWALQVNEFLGLR